jgi:RuvA, C-terminal domain
VNFGDYVVYGWMSFLAFGAISQHIDRRKTAAKAPNIGYRAAHANKARVQFVARAQPVRGREGGEVKPVADPTRADVISALRNLGWNAKQSNAAYEKSKGTCFDERLKDALALMKTHNETVLIHRH